MNQFQLPRYGGPALTLPQLSRPTADRTNQPNFRETVEQSRKNLPKFDTENEPTTVAPAPDRVRTETLALGAIVRNDNDPSGGDCMETYRGKGKEVQDSTAPKCRGSAHLIDQVTFNRGIEYQSWTQSAFGLTRPTRAEPVRSSLLVGLKPVGAEYSGETSATNGGNADKQSLVAGPDFSSTENAIWQHGLFCERPAFALQQSILHGGRIVQNFSASLGSSVTDRRPSNVGTPLTDLSVVLVSGVSEKITIRIRSISKNDQIGVTILTAHNDMQNKLNSQIIAILDILKNEKINISYLRTHINYCYSKKNQNRNRSRY